MTSNNDDRGFGDSGPETWNIMDWSPTPPDQMLLTTAARSLFSPEMDEAEIRQLIVRAQSRVLDEFADTLRPYMCVLRFAFVLPRLHLHPRFHVLVPDVERLESFVDLGCCMGADIRYLLKLGAPRRSLLGLDYSQTFLAEGCSLWDNQEERDENNMELFHQCDALLSSSLLHVVREARPEWWLLEASGGVNLVHVGSVLHTFETAESIQHVCQSVYDLLSPGGCFFGSNRPCWLYGTPEKLKKCLENIGFVQVTVEQRKVVLPKNNSNVVVKDGWGPTWFSSFKPVMAPKMSTTKARM